MILKERALGAGAAERARGGQEPPGDPGHHPVLPPPDTEEPLLYQANGSNAKPMAPTCVESSDRPSHTLFLLSARVTHYFSFLYVSHTIYPFCPTVPQTIPPFYPTVSHTVPPFWPTVSHTIPLFCPTAQYFSLSTFCHGPFPFRLPD